MFDVIAILQSAGAGAAAGMTWGLIGFFKNSKHLKQEFKTEKFVQTVASYVIIGGVFGGLGLTETGEAQGWLQSGAMALTGSELLKQIYKYFQNNKKR